jgi:hypothetical protein
MKRRCYARPLYMLASQTRQNRDWWPTSRGSRCGDKLVNLTWGALNVRATAHRVDISIEISNKKRHLTLIPVLNT